MHIQLSTLAEITSNGAILLGRYAACDAFDDSRPLRIVTHAHADHIMGLGRSLKVCEKILMTRATWELITVLKGRRFLLSGKVTALDYGDPYEYGQERLTLIPADHILGSAQVLVETAEGKRVAYTGDFRIDMTPIVPADVLVMEATYGGPWCQRPSNREVSEMLIDLVGKAIRNGPVTIFGYYGKLQEVMQLLNDSGVNVPFIMPEKIHQFSMIYAEHGMRLGKILCVESEEAMQLIKEGGSYVAFHHMNSRSKVHGEGLRIYVSGWMFSNAYRRLSENECLVALSDHSDFKGLLEYVRLSRPKKVVLDNYRMGHAEVLAREIQRQLGIPAMPMPSGWKA